MGSLIRARCFGVGISVLHLLRHARCGNSKPFYKYRPDSYDAYIETKMKDFLAI